MTEKKKDYTRDWNFIKMHYQLHAFDDVLCKGATRNYNTKPNEKLHKPMRDAYHRRTNFKSVEKQVCSLKIYVFKLKFAQILDVDHYLLVSEFIQSKIDDLDSSIAERDKELSFDKFSESNKEEESHQYQLKSKMKAVRLSEFEAVHSHDVAFNNFRRKLANHLTSFLQAYNIPLPDNKHIKIKLLDTVMSCLLSSKLSINRLSLDR